MTRRTVSGMFEEAPGIRGGDRRERGAYRFYEALLAPGRSLA